MHDLSGKRFGRLATIEQCGRTADHRVIWLCRCDCGSLAKVIGRLLMNGETQSCGCLRQQLATKHGYSKTETYHAWQQMIQRCHNPRNNAYANYGGRGITVCQRWRVFCNFLEDMGKKPADKTLDRIDNQSGYRKSNCKWSTPKQQARNRRDNLTIVHNGKTQCLTDWAKETGLSRATIKSRLDSGWPIQKAMKKPARKYKKS